MVNEKVLMEQKKMILNAFLFDIAPEFSEKYCNASEEERRAMRETNNEFLTKVRGGTRK